MFLVFIFKYTALVKVIGDGIVMTIMLYIMWLRQWWLRFFCGMWLTPTGKIDSSEVYFCLIFYSENVRPATASGLGAELYSSVFASMTILLPAHTNGWDVPWLLAILPRMNHTQTLSLPDWRQLLTLKMSLPKEEEVTIKPQTEELVLYFIYPINIAFPPNLRLM